MYCLRESRAAFAAAFESSRLAALLLLENPFACCLAASRLSVSFTTCRLRTACLWARRCCLVMVSPRAACNCAFFSQRLPGPEYVQQCVCLIVLLVGVDGRACGGPRKLVARIMLRFEPFDLGLRIAARLLEILGCVVELILVEIHLGLGDVDLILQIVFLRLGRSGQSPRQLRDRFLILFQGLLRFLLPGG